MNEDFTTEELASARGMTVEQYEAELDGEQQQDLLDRWLMGEIDDDEL